MRLALSSGRCWGLVHRGHSGSGSLHRKLRKTLVAPSTGHCRPQRRLGPRQWPLCPPHPAATGHIKPCCTARRHVQGAVPRLGSISSVQIMATEEKELSFRIHKMVTTSPHSKFMSSFFGNKFAESLPLFLTCCTDSFYNQSSLMWKLKYSDLKGAVTGAKIAGQAKWLFRRHIWRLSLDVFNVKKNWEGWTTRINFVQDLRSDQ